ncbi:MAG: hypothetical protein R3C32_10460 [Chloroflexota bacterium]
MPRGGVPRGSTIASAGSDRRPRAAARLGHRRTPLGLRVVAGVTRDWRRCADPD